MDKQKVISSNITSFKYKGVSIKISQRAVIINDIKIYLGEPITIKRITTLVDSISESLEKNTKVEINEMHKRKLLEKVKNKIDKIFKEETNE